MKGRDNKRSRSEIQSQMEDKSFDNDSDWSLKIDQALEKKRPKPPRAQKDQMSQVRKHDPDGDIPVWCKFCLKTECRLDGILKHVKKFHPDLYDSKAGRNSYAAEVGQKIPDDPKFLELESDADKG